MSTALYLRVGEPIAAHSVGENETWPGAGVRRWRQLRLVEKTGDLEPKILTGNWRLDDTKGNAQHMRSPKILVWEQAPERRHQRYCSLK
jgi:hypothetical protein